MSNDLKAANLFDVHGLVAVITGGGSGLGRMIAKALSSNGAKAVYIVGRRSEPLEETAKMGTPGTIVPIVGDVTSKESLIKIADQVRTNHGYLNVLVANSGITGPTLHSAGLGTDRKPSIKEFSEALWAPSMEEFSQASHVNCTSVFYTTLAFLELLDAGNSNGNVPQKSQIIVTASIAGMSRKISAGFAYSTSKAAAVHLSKTMATYFLPYHIRVNCIAPGIYPSEMTQRHFPDSEKKPWEEGALKAETVPLLRAGSEQDMAGAAMYLISSAGGYVNGEVLITDGGRLSMGMT